MWFAASALVIAMSAPGAVAGERLGTDHGGRRTMVTPEGSGSDTVASVRARDAAAARLLQFGAENSATFRALLADLRRSNVIVYVQVQHDPASAPGGSLRFIGGGGRFRWVMATVDTGSARYNAFQENLVALTAILGHELQHAREVSAALAIRTAADFDTHFRTVGIDVRRDTVDTDAARHVGQIVAAELSGPSIVAQRTEASSVPTAEIQPAGTPSVSPGKAVPLATGAWKRGASGAF